MLPVNPSVMAERRSLAMAESSPRAVSCCIQRAKMPVTVGVAIEVPCMVA